ncbi:glycosyltransferase family 4 protein [Fimbriimonadia bacterium ATM]|nr:MAG: glycosyltransferase family 1 protein [Armatimonadota bacterium]MBC6968714.1 glycosyltransferase family 1 protein [Armatimonadota bacterium]MCE7899843.1 glycosyltransferase family 1 protein [Armatimonadetes bacterium ATM1]MDL1928703.1 glycosyltransferase family 4 protein [Fimbriimonadia bacterium ATM]
MSGGEKLRVVVVGPVPPPIGGVETVTQALLESSAMSGFDVTHCDLTKGRPKQTQGKFDLGNFRWAWIHIKRLKKAVREARPHVVYMPLTATWSGFLRDLALARVAKRGGAKVVAHVHGAWFDQILDRRGWSGRVVRKGLDLFDCFLMLGERWRRLITEYGVRGEVRIVPSTFRREVFERGGEATRHYEGSAKRILFLGQLGKRKGVPELLRALAGVRGDLPEMRAVFVGPGEFEGEWEEMLALRKELGLEEIAEFTGSLQGDDLYAKFRECDLFVLPSHSEGLPVVLFEAGAFGLPVIATPVGAIADLIVHEESGLLVEPGDVDGLAAAIRTAAADAGLRQRLATNLRSAIQPFHPDVVTQSIADAIRETASRG